MINSFIQSFIYMQTHLCKYIHNFKNISAHTHTYTDDRISGRVAEEGAVEWVGREQWERLEEGDCLVQTGAQRITRGFGGEG